MLFAAYGPVMRFVENALAIIGRTPGTPSGPHQARLMSAATAASSPGSSTPPPRSRQGANDATAAAFGPSQVWLKQSVEEFVVESFLPQVWVDLRGRCVVVACVWGGGINYDGLLRVVV